VALVGSDEVEHEIGTTTGCELAHGVDRRCAVDDIVGPELGRKPPPPLVGVDPDDLLDPRLLDQPLDEKGSPPARDASHEYAALSIRHWLRV